MAKLNDLLKEMAGEIPGLISTGIVGMDGLGLAHYTSGSEFDVEVADAQFALVLKLVQKTIGQLGEDNVEDNLVSTKNTYILTRFLGDGSFYLGIFADKNNASLGNIRLVARQYASLLWNAIPKRNND